MIHLSQGAPGPSPGGPYGGKAAVLLRCPATDALLTDDDDPGQFTTTAGGAIWCHAAISGLPCWTECNLATARPEVSVKGLPVLSSHSE
jgi:hypothetical protein